MSDTGSVGSEHSRLLDDQENSRADYSGRRGSVHSLVDKSSKADVLEICEVA